MKYSALYLYLQVIQASQGNPSEEMDRVYRITLCEFETNSVPAQA